MNEDLKTELQELIPQYAETKAKLDNYKELADAQNKRIKQIMRELGEKESKSNEYTVKYMVSKRVSMDEDKLLDVILHANLGSELHCRLIKTKQYVDTNALENAMFKEEIPNDVILSMDKCKNVTEYETLKISKTKER